MQLNSRTRNVDLDSTTVTHTLNREFDECATLTTHKTHHRVLR